MSRDKEPCHTIIIHAWEHCSALNEDNSMPFFYNFFVFFCVNYPDAKKHHPEVGGEILFATRMTDPRN
jgi:hypothetical protein